MQEINRNIGTHISDRNNVNITLNIYYTGNTDVTVFSGEAGEYYRIYYVNEGSGSVKSGDAQHKVIKGSVFVIFPNTEFSMRPEFSGGLNVSFVAFSGHKVDQYLRRMGITRNYLISQDYEGEIGELFDKIVADSRSMPNRYCKLCASLYLILSDLIDIYNKGAETSNHTPEYYLMKALDFIDIYYTDSISIEDIASTAGVSRKQLYTIFKDFTDLSPKEYLIFYRISQAEKYLVNTDYTMESISELVGYSNQFYFSKEFKKVTGVTPTTYRQEQRVGEYLPHSAKIENIKEKYK